MDPLVPRVVTRYRVASLERAGQVLERASFANGDGALTVSVIQDTSSSGKPSYYLAHSVSHYGVSMDSTLRLAGPPMLMWLISALAKTLRKMGEPSSYELHELAPEIDVADGMEVPDEKVYAEDSGVGTV